MPRSQSNLFSMLVIIVAIVGGYVYYSNFGEIVIQTDPNSSRKTELDDFDSINIDFTILDSDYLKSLQKFGENPVTTGVTGGRKDIFSPLP